MTTKAKNDKSPAILTGKKADGISVIMPCLNEEETLKTCIQKAREGIDVAKEKKYIKNGEIIIADNGSTDHSIHIARELGVRVVSVSRKGYGAALAGGIAQAKYNYLLMADADDSYDFREIPNFVRKLNENYGLVMGSRLKGKIEKGAMPFLHRYFGNPVLSFIVRMLFRSRVSDSHCGLRAFTADTWAKLGLKSPGMEFASEMVIHAALLKIKTGEYPITLSPDGRSRSPHLRTFRDGWRHLKFMFLYRLEVIFSVLAAISIGLLIWAVEMKRGPVLSTSLLFSSVIWMEILIWSFQFPFRPEVQSKKAAMARKFRLKKYWLWGIISALSMILMSFCIPEEFSANSHDMYSQVQWRYALQAGAGIVLAVRFTLGWIKELIRVRLEGIEEF